jgi:hypothetical protein
MAVQVEPAAEAGSSALELDGEEAGSGSGPVLESRHRDGD